MKFKIIIIFYYLLIFIISCSSPTENNYNGNKEKSIIYNVDSILSEDPIYFSSLFDEFEIVKLETNFKSIVGKIASVHIMKERLVIVDKIKSKSVTVFDNNGKFFNTISQFGNGPLEYVELTSVKVNKLRSEVYILDAYGGKILKYDLDGNFISTYALDIIDYSSNKIVDFVFDEDDNLYLAFKKDNVNEESFLVKKIMKDGRIYSYLNGIDRGLPWVHPTNTQYVFSEYNSEIFFFQPYLRTVFGFDNNSIYKFITLKTDLELSNEELKALSSYGFDNQFKSMNLEPFTGPYNFMESSEFLFAGLQINGLPHFLINFKKTNDVKLLSYENFIDDMVGTNSFSPPFHGIGSTKVVRVIYPNKIGMMLEFLKNNNIEGYEYTHSLLGSLTNNDGNAFLIFYKLK